MGSSLSSSGQYNVNEPHSYKPLIATKPHEVDSAMLEINQKLTILTQILHNKPSTEANKLIINSNEITLSGELAKNCYYSIKTDKLSPRLIKKIQTQNEDTALSENVLKELHLLQKLSSEKFSPLLRLLEFEIRPPQIYFMFEDSLMPLSYFLDNCERNQAYTEICIKRIYLFGLRALLFLQHLNVVHGSLSEDSFFLKFKKTKNFNLKLLDLNTIKDGNNQLQKSKYSPPESLDNNKSNSYDCWSFGVILHKMIYNNQYPKRRDDLSIDLLPIQVSCLKNFTEILKSCLELDFKKRANAFKLYEITKKFYPENCSVLLSANFMNYLSSLYENVLIDSANLTPAETPKNKMPNNLPRIQNTDASNVTVRMPFSDSAKWEKITTSLNLLVIKLSKSNFKSQMIQDTIMSYNAQHKDDWNFDNFHEFLSRIDFSQENMRSLIRRIVQLVVELPRILNHDLHILRRGQNRQIDLNAKECASLLANAMFCTFPTGNASNFNFNRLYEKSMHSERNQSKIEKFRCIIHYFERICGTGFTEPIDLISFKRQSFDYKDLYSFKQSSNTIIKPNIYDRGSIEDCSDSLQVDFANKNIGGGVLGNGSVQEEIRFVISPELIVSRLICEPLEDNEVILIKGSQRFSSHRGYSNSFEWLENYQDNTEYDDLKRRKTTLVAMDALPFRDRMDQFENENIKRDLLKCFAGFSNKIKNDGFDFKSIATGHWGCGAFNGDKEIKFLIQLLVASELKKSLNYFTFNDRVSKQEFEKIIETIQRTNMFVKDLYESLFEYANSKLNESRDWTRVHNPMSFSHFISNKYQNLAAPLYLPLLIDHQN